MKVFRSARIAFLFLAAFLFQTDKSMAFAATVPPGACLYALDSTASRAFQIAGAQSVYTACGVVSESSASDGFEMEGAETLYLQNHAQVSVVGGAQLNGQTYLLDTINNKQVQAVKVSSPGDPLASIVAPTSGTIISKSHAYFDMNSKPAKNTLSPGVYCGGLTIGNTNGTAFTMSPGVYIMAGGGFVLNSQAVVKGTGVTVYNTSSAGWGCSSSYNYTPITISGQVTATLSAPTSGALDGVLFFGNRTGCSTKGSCVDQINGGSTTVLNGALYFASDEIEITGSNASGYMMLVADKIYINGISTFGNNGSPFDKITVSVSPSTATLYAGQTQQFTATVNNSANSAVTWAISPAGVGSISSSGLYTAPSSVTAAQTVSVTATSQADTGKSATATVNLAVKTTPVITWATPAAITYGTALSATQLDATASVAGTFAYSPAAGSVLTAGAHTLSVTFTPTNTTSYNSATASVTLIVNKATPTITWTTPATITYGTALSATQQDATASVAGTFAYTPAAGTVLSAGSQTLSVTLTPTDATDYSTATATVPLTVNKATPKIIWATPAAITYGTALSSTQLDASSTVAGTLAYTPASGTVLTAGLQTLSVTFTPTDTTDYNAATATVALTVNQATPTITWATPAAITYGTALSATQLDATANVAGTFAYTPAAGTVLTAGPQALSVVFTPTDTTDYTTATATVALMVNQAVLTVTANNASRAYGTANPSFTDTITGFINGEAASVVSGTASLTTMATSTSAVGSYPITAAVGTLSAANYSFSFVTGTLTITSASQTINFTALTSPVTYGVAPISLSATATSGLAVSFSVLSGPATVSGNTLTITGPGTVVVAADQAGNSDYSAAAEVTQAIVVNIAPSFTELASSLNPSTYGQNVTFSALVSTGGVSPTGSVSFADNGMAINSTTVTPVQTTNLIVYSQANAVAWSSDETGSAAPVIAVYSGLDPFGGTNALQMAFPAPGAGTSDSFNTVNVSGAFAGQAFTASVWLSAPLATTLNLLLNEVGGSNLSASHAVTVGTAWQRYSVSLLIPTADSVASSLNLVLVNPSGQSATTINVFGAQVEDATSEGPYVATNGTVQSGYGAIASFATTTLTPGSHPIVAAYSGDVNDAASTSATLPQVVNDATATLILAASVNPIVYGAPVTFTATISNNLTGTVTFYDGSTAIGTGTLSGGSATLTTNVLTAGSHTVTAAWAGNADYNPATSPAITLIVNQATPTIVWATPADITYGTALSATQLNATANVPGTFAYTPAAGTVLPAGAQALSVTFTPNDTVDYTTATATVTLTVNQPVSITVTPSSAILYGGQTQQFTASVSNTSNTAVVWTIVPAGVGMIDSTGLYTAPATISAQQTVTITATSLADSSKSATAAVTLSLAQCGTNGYSYQRAIVIDHTKVPNTDQTNFPFLFNTTDPLLATTANGGHVTSSNGYDIIFTSDAAGQNKLDYEIEKYDPTIGQVVAWVRIPTISHSTDTVIYVFYGNSSITASQQNSTSVWDSNYLAVYHLANIAAGTAADSTTNGNNGTLTSVLAASGEINGAASFNGTSSFIQIPSADFAPYPTSGSTTTGFSASFGGWFKTASAGVLLGQTNGAEPGGSPSDWVPALYVDTAGSLRASMFWHGSASSQIVSTTAYNDNKWHYAVDTYANGTEILYVDGQSVGSQQAEENGYASSYAYFFGTGETSSWSSANGAWLYFNGALDEISISNTARSADWIAGEYNNQSSSSTFYALYSENAVEVVPDSVSLYAGQSQQFTASGACGADITWSMPSGALGTLTAGGLYTAPASIATQQTLAITATSQGNVVSTGDGIVTLLPAPINPTLTLTAAAQPPYVTGTSQTFMATLKNQDGTPIAGEAVTFTVAGANGNTGGGTTNVNGVATYTYTGTNRGTDTIQATANVSGVQVVSNTLSAVWIVPAKVVSATTVTGYFFLSDGSGDFDTPRSATPAFTQEFPVINFNPPAGTIPGNTSSVNVMSRPFTDVTTDLNGNFTGTIVAQGNGYQAGVGPMETFQAVFRGTFTVASAGNVVFNFYNDDGFILGIGNGATRVSGASHNMPAVTPFAQFPVMGADNETTSPVGNQIIVYFPSAGEYPYEVDYSECCSGQLVLTMTSGATNPTGIPPTGSLTLAPNTVQPLHVGGQQAFTVLASDASGAPLSNVRVGLEVTDADILQLGGTTDSTGYATILYHDVNPGTALVQAVAFIDGMVSYSNQVSVPWTLPAMTTTTTGGSNTLSISISALTTVTLPNGLTLTGTVTDSAGLTPTLVWSKVSGPGTVIFSTPQQAATTASFSEAGSYVLELSASDTSGNSGSTDFTVTVDAVAETNQGWIGSPTYGSAVSGVVPITVASGITLASGTLTYYPASSPNSVTVLNANTTGSGQIGTLDTTVLPNGTYWIQLQGTDTSGNQQYALVLVVVTGSYKPGRVTATVTDLVVPSTGLSINIQRSYDSLNDSTIGDFGYGWNLGVNVNLVVDPKGDVTFTLGGQRKTFYLTHQQEGCSPLVGCIFPWYWPIYTAEPGLHGTLTNSASGCADYFDMLTADGYCIGGGQFTPPGYIYTDPNGTSYTISAAGNLQSIQDRSGNGLTITTNGITSTTGLSVPFVRDAKNRITQITDPQGNIYSYGYDDNGNLATVTYPSTTQPSTYTYDSNHLYLTGTDGRSNPLPVTTYYTSTDTDASGNSLNGRLQSVTDPLGNTTSYAYDLATTTTTVTYPDNGKATMVYDSYGDLQTSTDPLGNTTTNVYDAKHNLTSVTDPLGHKTVYTYDANGNKTSTTYPATGTSTNTTSTTAYNQYSEPTSTTDELGNVRAFNYDANYNPQSVTDSAGTLASFIFNSNSTLAAGTIGYDISTSPSLASQFTYDANGNMASRMDALGRTTTYTYDSLGHKTAMVTPTPTTLTGGSASTTTYQYDALGNLTQTAAPLGRTTSSQYDANGNKLYDIDALGNKTSYAYDALNRLITTTYPDQTTSTKSYDFRNNVIDEKDQAGNTTHHTYDQAGRQTSVTRGYGAGNASTTSYDYDAAGRKTSETDALGHTTSYSYDAAGHLVAISGVKGNTTYAYDNAGNQVSRTDANGNTTQFQYDARKRLIKTTYPDGTAVVNTYDGPGNLASVTDQAGSVVQYTYDAANQLKTVVQVNHPKPSNNTNLYGYDSLGNLIGLTDENLHTTQNSFDLLNEPVSKVLPDQAHTETRKYDAAGNLVSLTHFNGVTTTYTYDALNRLLSRITPGESPVSFTYTPTGKYLTSTAADGTVDYTYDALDRLITKATPEGTLNYTYDAAGHVESIVSSNTNGVSVSYSYDDLNRLSTVVDNRLPGQNTTSYTYDNASNVATATYPNGLQSSFTYDSLNRLTSLVTPVSGYSYQLGPTGNRTEAVELKHNRVVSWNYDGIYRLTGETISSSESEKSGTVSYSLDPVGNRLSASSTLSGINSGSFTYNANDEQVSSETYDANGNTLSTRGKSFTYDSENHLTSMISSGTVVTIVYDAFGNRVAKTVNSVTTKYLVEDDVNPTGLPQVLEETVNGVVQREYTYGLQRISQYQSINGAWTASFYGYDGAGSVRQLTNTAGVVTDEYEYDAFGNSFTEVGTTPNVYLYRGEQYDSDLGLYYLRARYYNPSTGRFMSRDPEDGKAKIPATLHKYLYAGGDPVNLIDPMGREAMLETGSLDAIIGPYIVTTIMKTGAAIACVELAVQAALDKALGQNYTSTIPWPVDIACILLTL